jgi:predicted acylesterase/phospholipase RssA/CRP-like cAMP-binding protein
VTQLSFLRDTELFGSVPEPALAALAARCQPAALSAGDVLFRQGDEADALYVVIDGRLLVVAETAGGERPVGTVERGECVGEGALLLSGRRAATVRAALDTRLLTVPRLAFEGALAEHPGLRAVLTLVVARRLPALLAAEHEIFGELDDAARAEIHSQLSWLHLNGGDVLFHGGDAGDALYVVLQGRLQAVRETKDGGTEVVTEIGRGETVGEMALLTGEQRTLTVRAIRDTDLIRFAEAGFRALLERRPRALLPMLRTMARRLRATGERAAAAAPTTAITVAPVGGLALRPFLDALLGEQREHGRVLVLDPEAFDREHGRGAARAGLEGAQAIYLSDWLHRQEAAHDVVVFVADADAGPWSQLCLRQADRIVLVADAQGAPGLGGLAALLAPGAGRVPRDLVLLHAEAARAPHGTAEWLRATGAERHHHVRTGVAGDARRVSRFLGGRAVGLVLSGGGARGFAHAAVVRALREAGVPIDFVGGCSMGSLVAACHAVGFGFEETVRALRRCFVETNPQRGYTLPLVSVFSPDATERALVEIFGDTQIEDLWTSFYCVATNLTQATPHVFRHGLLWRAMRASGAFPGLLPPVPIAGDLFVDGGLLDNLPVEVLQGLCPGPILASDTTQETDLRVDPSLERCPSPGQLLIERLRGAPRTVVPGPVTVLMRALECRDSDHQRRQRAAADFCFHLPVGEYGLVDFQRIEAILAAGYAYAREAVTGLPPSVPRADS